ncbi:hypothetical protein [Candidatus Liberibacter asiaticus]|uniref:hypothetical protein n=1 Tax=Liberibacter asiaticus TaxID=34021 RepID=UPI004059546F
MKIPQLKEEQKGYLTVFTLTDFERSHTPEQLREILDYEARFIRPPEQWKSLLESLTPIEEISRTKAELEYRHLSTLWRFERIQRLLYDWMVSKRNVWIPREHAIAVEERLAELKTKYPDLNP